MNQPLRFFVELLFLLAFSSSAVELYGQRFNSPLEYMDYIGEQHQTITEDMWNYVKTAAHSRNASKIDSKRKEVIKSLSLAKARIKRLPDYEGDGSYRDSVVAYLEISYLVLKGDYEKIINMEEIAEQSYDLMEAYLTAKKQAYNKLNHAADIAQQQQIKFANLYGIQLIEEENNLHKRLDEAIEVYDYYDILYLAFFKSYKQEFYVLEALNKQDLSSFEQNRKVLIQFSAEGLHTLDYIGGFKGDYSLSQECRKALVFFNSEAKDEFVFFSEFILKQENLLTISKAMEDKSHGQRSEKEVNEYNSIVNEFNMIVNKYNEENDLLNKERNEIFDTWNKTVDKFINKNVP